jgi:transcriptional regulator GlxA family with amidase domain
MRTRPYSLAVICFDEMDLLDIAGPLEIFSSAGRKWNWRAIKADLVATHARPIPTRAQLELGPVLSLDAAPEPELLLIPGGYGARVALQDAVLIDYLARQRARITLTLAIGLGALLAARAGLLSGSEVAAREDLLAELRALDDSITTAPRGALGLAARAFTAASSGQVLDLGLETIAKLLGKPQALSTARELGYAWGTEILRVDIVRD